MKCPGSLTTEAVDSEECILSCDDSKPYVDITGTFCLASCPAG